MLRTNLIFYSDKELIIYLVDNCLTKDQILNLYDKYRRNVWHELNNYLPYGYDALICRRLSLNNYDRYMLLDYLIKNGLGFINIDYNLKDELNKKLLELYEWNDSSLLKKLIKDKCYYAKQT